MELCDLLRSLCDTIHDSRHSGQPLLAVFCVTRQPLILCFSVSGSPSFHLPLSLMVGEVDISPEIRVTSSKPSGCSASCMCRALTRQTATRNSYRNVIAASVDNGRVPDQEAVCGGVHDPIY